MCNAFEWVKDLMKKPVAICLACRGAYFPHLGGCYSGCHDLNIKRFYRMVEEMKISEQYWVDYRKREGR